MDGHRPASPRPSDAVLGVVDRDRLSETLAATHRAGFGPHARVLDGGRGDLAGQLRRAGWTAPLPSDLDPRALLVLVNAPGRGARVADTLAHAGAHAVLRAADGEAAPLSAASTLPTVPMLDSTPPIDAASES